MSEYPAEVTPLKAAEILAVTPKTVRAYIRDGLLPARDVSRYDSTRAVWRVPLDAVEAMRRDYRYLTPA